jgi:hypothetical protein
MKVGATGPSRTGIWRAEERPTHSLKLRHRTPEKNETRGYSLKRRN